MSEIKVKPWRQKNLNQIWDAGLPEFLFRNKTHLLSIVRQYRLHFDSEVFSVHVDQVAIALLFVEPVFLDERTLNGYLIPTKLFPNTKTAPNNLMQIIGTEYYSYNQKFEQLVLYFPDANKKIIPGNETAMFLGQSTYPNALSAVPFAAADFLDENFILFRFHNSYIVVTVIDNYITQIYFLSLENKDFEPALKKSLVKSCFLNDEGYIASNREVIKLYSKTKRLDSDLEVKILEQFSNYLTGKSKQFDLPYKVTTGTEFQKEVWNILKDIPYGNVLSYVEVAERLENRKNDAKNYARAVGSACGKNPLGIIIPCHRVIGNDRSLTGFAGGIELKGRLLDLEFFNRIGGN